MDDNYPKFSALGRYHRDSDAFLSLEAIYDTPKDECPYCRSHDIHPYGYVKSNHRHRYRCGECGHTFVTSVGTLLYRSRMSTQEIRKACDSLNYDMTVRSTAKYMEVSKNTAMRYRRILLSVLQKANDKGVLGGKDVQVDETYVTLSGMINGNRKLRGISRQKAAIAVGVDSEKGLLMDYIGDGHPTTEGLKKNWEGKIREGSIITHDTLHGYAGVFDAAKPEKERWVNSGNKDEERLLDDLNHACSGIKWFLRKHRGITPCHLQLYLDWYRRIETDPQSTGQFEEGVLGNLLPRKTPGSTNNT